MVDVSTIPDGIVALKVQNTDAVNSAAGYVTIGHVFQRGDVPRTFTLGAKSSGRNLEIQTM